ncbi:MAG: hypothetical protein ACRDT6_21775, partial [Micromonosporaceae bacterium]
MGARSADDDGRKPDGMTSADDPVPAPWGAVVIPDDLSELDAEAAQVRHELRGERRRRRWRRLFGATDPAGGPGVVGPLVIVALAMTLALVSLFGGFWPYQAEDRATGDGPAPGARQPLPDLVLSDAAGTTVRLRELSPVVVLAVGRCECTGLIARTAELGREQGLAVAVIGQPHAPPLPPGSTAAVRALADPYGTFAHTVAPRRASRTGTALVVLVDKDGTMTQLMHDVQSVEEFASGARRLR